MKTNKKTNPKHKLSNVIFFIAFVILFVVVLVSAVKGLSLCNHIQNDDVKEYVGEFTIRKRNSSRNTTYYITLENGDILRANPDHMDDNRKFLSASSLSFVYSSPKEGVSSAYNCVEIKDTESGTVYLDRSVVYAETKGGVYIALAIEFVFLLLITIPALLYMLGSPRRKKKPRK